MATYDYRIDTNRLNEADSRIDRLSKNQLIRLSEIAEDIQQSDEKKRLDSALIYFDNAILPTMKEFAEISGSLLEIEKSDNMQTIIATFRCPYGFDITESCRFMRGWLIIANHIGISTENGEPNLSLIFDCNELC